MQARTEEIRTQTELLEQQREEIISGLRYASRIQQSLLPQQNEMRAIFPNSFLIFKPKDIVSGDFFWCTSMPSGGHWLNGQALQLFALVDCTGHGVPGALMSVLAVNALEKAVQHPDVQCPASALQLINNNMYHTLNAHNEAQDSLRDGMEIALGAIDPATKTLYFSGARINLYLWRNQTLSLLKASRSQVGSDLDDMQSPFEVHRVQLQSGDRIYAFTDGVPDQFGGSQSKKLKSKPLIDMIASLDDQPVCMQGHLLQRAFELWMGQEEQVDDATMIGIEIA